MQARRILIGGILLVGFVTIVSGRVGAHGGAVSGARGAVTAPLWLVVLTGGGVTAVSFLLSSFVTDRALIEAIHECRWNVEFRPTAGRIIIRGVGIGLFVLVVVAGLLGPASSTNPAIVLVWIVWWAGFVASTYLVGNSWPALDPFRTITDRIPNGVLSYPSTLGCWPATVGLIAFAWFETSSPSSTDPGLVSILVLGYGVLSVVGATLFGSNVWYERVDPLARLFRYYGALAPLHWSGSRVRLRLPGSGLRRVRLEERGEVGFVVGMVWVTTFDGLVYTDAWRAITETVAASPVPMSVVSLGGLVGGFSLFYGTFRIATRRVRDDAPTPISPSRLARRIAPSLIPIAAGYHFAHFSTYFLSGLPLAWAAVTPPYLTVVDPTLFVVPSWMSIVAVAAILVGHLGAVWVAHSIAFELFPGRLQAIRSQYAPVTVMVVYTAVSLWIVAQPIPGN